MLSGTFICNSSTFGGDPAFGYIKECACTPNIISCEFTEYTIDPSGSVVTLLNPQDSNAFGLRIDTNAVMPSTLFTISMQGF